MSVRHIACCSLTVGPEMWADEIPELGGWVIWGPVVQPQLVSRAAVERKVDEMLGEARQAIEEILAGWKLSIPQNSRAYGVNGRWRVEPVQRPDTWFDAIVRVGLGVLVAALSAALTTAMISQHGAVP